MYCVYFASERWDEQWFVTTIFSKVIMILHQHKWVLIEIRVNLRDNSKILGWDELNCEWQPHALTNRIEPTTTSPYYTKNRFFFLKKKYKNSKSHWWQYNLSLSALRSSIRVDSPGSIDNNITLITNKNNTYWSNKINEIEQLVKPCTQRFDISASVFLPL